MKKAFWKNYDIGLVPGPTKVPDEVGAAYAHDFASSDLEPEYLAYYAHMQQRVQKLLNTKNVVHFMTGEAMVTLWGALKSVLVPGDDVLVIAAGS
jgi:aspartate aminotransferase-like enzyme